MKRKILVLIFASICVMTINSAKADDGPTLVTKINAYGTGGGAGGALQASWNASNSTVTITNSTPITGATQYLELEVNTGIKILWQAKLTGSTTRSLIDITGDSFEITNNGMIKQTDIGKAIQLTGNVIVNGGTVASTSDNAIFTDGNVTVNAGTVSTTHSSTITAFGNVIITGGMVSSTAYYSAIFTYGNVTVTGGIVKGTTLCAIHALGVNSMVAVNGGVVFAEGSNILGFWGVIYLPANPTGFIAPFGNGVVIAWAPLAIEYVKGTDTDITVLPENCAKWDIVGGKSGISYEKGTNKGFLEIAGITVSLPVAPTITTTSLPNGTVGKKYNATLTASGSTPITWSLESGSLPSGLNLSSAGEISGKPEISGTFNFTVKVSNNAGSDTKELSIFIDEETGISGLQIAEIKIFPNPTNDRLIVDCEHNLQNRVIFYDITGKEVLSQNITGKTEINISNLQKGIYIVSIMSESEVVGNFKIVKQ